MIESFGFRSDVLIRLNTGPIGAHWEKVIESLRSESYSQKTIRRYLRAAELFSAWLVDHDLGIADANEARMAQYVETLGRHNCSGRKHGRLPAAALGLRKILTILRQSGSIAPASVTEIREAADEWLDSFSDYLHCTVDVSAGTCQIYLRYARAFLNGRFGAATPDSSILSAQDVSDFVRTQAAKLKRSKSQAPVSAMRAFLRFLVTKGLIPAGLEGAVPTIRQYKLASLPVHISKVAMDRMLAGCEEVTCVERRDKAILMLLARLGMRAGEVIGLRLEDIDWKEGKLLIRAGKTNRERNLPLPADVGHALISYIQDARRRSPHRAVFLQCCPPFAPLKSSSSVSGIARKHLKRSGISLKRMGAHTLRHTVATVMVGAGASFKEIADILGHQSLQTTAVYAKLDLKKLANVAMPWPGGEQ